MRREMPVLGQAVLCNCVVHMPAAALPPCARCGYIGPIGRDPIAVVRAFYGAVANEQRIALNVEFDRIPWHLNVRVFKREEVR